MTGEKRKPDSTSSAHKPKATRVGQSHTILLSQQIHNNDFLAPRTKDAFEWVSLLCPTHSKTEKAKAKAKVTVFLDRTRIVCQQPFQVGEA